MPKSMVLYTKTLMKGELEIQQNSATPHSQKINWDGNPFQYYLKTLKLLRHIMNEYGVNPR